MYSSAKFTGSYLHKCANMPINPSIDHINEPFCIDLGARNKFSLSMLMI